MSEEEQSRPPKQWAVRHNRTDSRFEAGTSRNPGHLDYLVAEGVVEMYHTEVPSEYRGQGVAERLARTALDWARENNYRVLPSCSYVSSFIRRHPEYHDLSIAPV